MIIVIVKSKKTKLKRTTFFHITPPSLTNLFITASHAGTHTCYDFNTHFRYWHVEEVACATFCSMYCMICYNVMFVVSPVWSSEWQWECVIMSLGQLLENHSSSATPVLASLLWWPHYHH